jgi:hypothetical protein
MYIYHGSHIQGRSIIEPYVDSTGKHGDKPYVYASIFKVVAAFFSATHGRNWTCKLSPPDPNGVFTLKEKFINAFDFRYKDRAGSIYVMDCCNFKMEGVPHLWYAGGECVSDVEVKVLSEERFDDASSFLYKLEAEGKLRIERSHQLLHPDYWERWHQNHPVSALEYRSMYPF